METSPSVDLLAGLNPEQREAVVYNQGPLLVIAGAGAGKTRVITHKVAFLLQNGVDANRILALTFTNKAAKEMIERTMLLLNDASAKKLWIGTFHSVAAKILRFEYKFTPYKSNFSIYDTSETKSLAKRIAKDYGFDPQLYTPSITLSRISKAKNKLILPSHYNDDAETIFRDRKDNIPDMARFYDIYQKCLLENNAMDFDDLLLNLYLLLKNNDEVRQKYCNIFQHILVDEYQDTNFIQNVLIQILAQPNNNLCVVGDDAQSIYAFRGADISNILNFMHVYKNAKIFKLQRNYRSTQTIVNASNALIAHNNRQIPKTIFSQRETGDKIKLFSFPTDKEESDGIAQLISRLLKNKQAKPEHFVILYRTNAQSRLFENALRQWNIPYQIYGSTGFFQRKEIKDVLAYLRLMVNEMDNEALLRIINIPKRGIGNTTIQAIQKAAVNYNTNLFDIISRLGYYSVDLSKATLIKIDNFAKQLLTMKQLINSLDAYKFALQLIDFFELKKEYTPEDNAENEERLQNIEELLHAIYDFTHDDNDEPKDIEHFLQTVSLLSDNDDKEKIENSDSHVSLMTIHTAKGLEFERVVIAGMEEHLFPSAFCITEEDFEEERRLFYVALTRAKSFCYLSYAKQRFRHGLVELSKASRFLSEINKDYLEINETEKKGSSNPFNNYPTMDNVSSLQPQRFEALNNVSSRSSKNTPTSRKSSSHVSQRLSPLERLSSRPSQNLPPLDNVSSRSTQNLSPLDNVSSCDLERTPITCNFLPNERVSHQTFGDGTVIETYHENGNDKIDINFDNFGLKTMLLKYVRLYKLTKD